MQVHTSNILQEVSILLGRQSCDRLKYNRDGRMLAAAVSHSPYVHPINVYKVPSMVLTGVLNGHARQVNKNNAVRYHELLFKGVRPLLDER